VSGQRDLPDSRDRIQERAAGLGGLLGTAGEFLRGGLFIRIDHGPACPAVAHDSQTPAGELPGEIGIGVGPGFKRISVLPRVIAVGIVVKRTGHKDDPPSWNCDLGHGQNGRQSDPAEFDLDGALIIVHGLSGF
jgi:hypothetical protein